MPGMSQHTPRTATVGSAPTLNRVHLLFSHLHSGPAGLDYHHFHSVSEEIGAERGWWQRGDQEPGPAGG